MAYGDHVERRSGGIIRSLISWVMFFVTMFVMVWVMQNFIVRAYVIPSGSMESTIEINDHVWSEKVSYYFRDIEYGDIVTFDDPEVAGRTLIKRVIATEGQTVDLIDGYVYVDGVQLDEPYTNGQLSEPLDTAANVTVSYPYTVPEGCIWVMGDNRTHSADSRYFGPVSVSSVSGRAAIIYWPIENIGVF
ncbi:signal peptidase I [Slackia heliotrinireducens]|uniref:signal peptidase I n=1 Tax=Slackia heliotrinireducens TaxID=84110 RepID=UPI0033157044